ncbi:MAG TPA: flagellar basal body P-ring formation chaperone FlgA [Albidovulum sp.]|uniref:flagellar basal body P-ring formation chaperone FlgA n=1 Tax=Albidovulum sp. TaxID=1872424 RepID=UPI002B9C075A|nr:flagellar basal body P-ring formation chaperone FlgA [Albidovulum sp.]
MRGLLCIAACLAGPAAADTVVALRSLQARTVIGAGDVALKSGTVAGAATRLEDVIGREMLVAVFKDRPVFVRNAGAPTLVERNQIVPLVFTLGTLVISAEGRALGRGGEGDLIRIMNTASRATVTGLVMPDGSVSVKATR